MKTYIDDVCEQTARDGLAIEVDKITLPGGYSDGAVVAPLDYELDEFTGVWLVQFGIAVARRFAVHTLDLGQARFRARGANDIPHPEAITKNQAAVKRDELIEALDQRFGTEHVSVAAGTAIEAMQIWQRLWPCGVQLGPKFGPKRPTTG